MMKVFAASFKSSLNLFSDNKKHKVNYANEITSI